MIIKSFGCSFVFGSDLSDLPITKVLVSPVGTFSRLTWPAVLASKKGCDYECHARPGSGNLQIAERVLNECTHDSNSFYVIDWTWIDRFDYIASEDFWQPWGTLRPTSEEDPARSYYKNLHSEYMDKLLTLIYIKTVLNKLLEKRIKFIMTYEDELIFDQRWHVSPAVKELQDSLSDHMTKFEGQTFLQWSRSNGYPESPNWHPLEQAHCAAADYMIAIFDKQRTDQKCLNQSITIY